MDDAATPAPAVELVRWPLVTASLPGTGGALKDAPEDFVVEEVPAYAPSGAGDHLWLWVEKRDVDAARLVDRVAAALGVRHTEIGAAGRKDRRAVTRQWLSAPWKRGHELPAPDALGWTDAASYVRVLNVTRHETKLRTGHLRGNRFDVRVRGLATDAATAADRARAKLDLLARTGLPNFYGEQRFGGGGGQVAFGRAVLRGEQRPPRDKGRARFLVSAVQGDLFNRWLALRLERGLLDRALAGDVLKKEDTGGLFACADPAADTPRVAALAVHPTGPMFGEEMWWAEGEAGALEAEVLAAAGLTRADFARHQRLGAGTRRVARVLVRDPQVRPKPATPPAVLGDDAAASAAHDDALALSFFLPKGTYATVLLREILEPA